MAYRLCVPVYFNQDDDIQRQGILKQLKDAKADTVFLVVNRYLTNEEELKYGIEDFKKNKDFFEEKIDDHAGELETSVMLHYYPELVRMDLAGDGKSNKFAIEGLNTKVAWLPRDWSRITKDTGVGYPKKATAEKGRRYMEAVIPRILQFVIDFTNKEIYDKL